MVPSSAVTESTDSAVETIQQPLRITKSWHANFFDHGTKVDSNNHGNALPASTIL
jgi:hypothetical protein